MYKLIIGLIVLTFTSVTHALPSMSGNWNCDMADNENSHIRSNSKLEINTELGVYEDNTEVNFSFKEFPSIVFSKKLFTKGTVVVNGGLIYFYPKEATSEVVNSGPLRKEDLEIDGEVEALLKDGSANIEWFSDYSISLSYTQSNLVFSCQK